MKHAEIVLLFCLLLLLINCGGRTKEDVEKAIARSGGLQRVDRLCHELPKPKGFEFIYKDIGGNSFTYGISYRYRTERPRGEIRKFYADWFSENGWFARENEAYTFRKNNQMIEIAPIGGAVTKNGGSEIVYSIYCTEEH
jgi:hypothetical protein